MRWRAMADWVGRKCKGILGNDDRSLEMLGIKTRVKGLCWAVYMSFNFQLQNMQ